MEEPGDASLCSSHLSSSILNSFEFVGCTNWMKVCVFEQLIDCHCVVESIQTVQVICRNHGVYPCGYGTLNRLVIMVDVKIFFFLCYGTVHYDDLMMHDWSVRWCFQTDWTFLYYLSSLLRDIFKICMITTCHWIEAFSNIYFSRW